MRQVDRILKWPSAVFARPFYRFMLRMVQSSESRFSTWIHPLWSFLGRCVYLTETIYGSAGHFCPVFVVRSWRKLVPFDETKKYFFDFGDILPPWGFRGKSTCTPSRPRGHQATPKRNPTDAKSPKSATRQHCKIENQKVVKNILGFLGMQRNSHHRWKQKSKKLKIS